MSDPRRSKRRSAGVSAFSGVVAQEVERQVTAACASSILADSTEVSYDDIVAEDGGVGTQQTRR